jgi:hypothetical protein
MQKRTKYCVVEITMLNGTRLIGRFHIDQSSSSSVRPSDAFRFLDSEFFLLTHATIENGETTTQRDVVLVRTTNISHVELRDGAWRADDVRKPVAATV